jgi:antitoxin component YwqK of YwqJK toxin-antitoxin module
MIEHRPDLLDSNIRLWKQENAPDLREVASPWEFCLTGKKEQLNLRQPLIDKYLHSPSNIDIETRQWFGKINPHQTDWIVVYGVGLGYYYQALRDWLHADQQRRVIFIEDDAGVLKAFFETHCAQELLQDPQAILLYIKESDFILPNLDHWLEKMLFRRLQITALASYEERRRQRMNQLRLFIDLFRELNQGAIGEYLLEGKAFFKNFYHNILQLDQCLDGSLCANLFQGKPAIVCGAGPSLAKNIELLKTLKSRAVIFAGGTAMNALNAYDFVPHFGCGVDPFFTHFSRIIANIAFETPYFVRSRMNRDALAILHGPRLYLPGATGYPVNSWIDQQLGYGPFSIEEGANVINLSLCIAKFLGCNPILCVGVDLGYTDGLAYPPGITAHGVHDPREQFVSKRSGEELILATDIYGQPIYTLMKWIVESLWYSSFAREFPEIKILNCTEGGIGFQGVPNVPLQEAADLYLKEQYDIDGQVHYAMAQIAKKAPPSVQQQKKALDRLADSLSSSSQALRNIKEQEPEIWAQELPAKGDKLQAVEEPLFAQEAYVQILKPFDDLFCQYMEASASKETPSLIQGLMKNRFPYLQGIVKDNIKCIEKALRAKIANVEALKKITDVSPIQGISHPQCALQNDELTIEDPLLKISIKEKVDTASFRPDTRSGFKQVYDSDGRLLHSAYYSNGLLHGPSHFYFPSGQVCSRSWYVRGLKEGTVEVFAENGDLLVQKSFKAGLEEGMNLYFYPPHRLKSAIPFSSGLLDGEVCLYYPNGALMRKMSFKQGKREGKDHLFSIDGKLLLEAEYSNDKPIHSAKIWYLDGTIAKEVVYRAPGVIAEIKRWDIEGNPVEDAQSADYFDKVARRTLQLGDLIQNISQEINAITATFKERLPEASDASVKEDLAELATEMEAFKKLQQEFLQTSGLDGTSDREAIWKTPSHAQWMKDFLYMASSPIQESIIKLQWKLKQLKGLFRNPPDDTEK